MTKGRWKLPKHILLSTTLRHLYRSKQLTTMLNRLGHCETYNFCLELESALAKALYESSAFITPQVITGDGNSIFYMEWDNLNAMNTNVSGPNVVNSTGGIMIQEVKDGFTNTNKNRMLPLYDRSTPRSLWVDLPATLAFVHIHKKIGPRIPENAILNPPAANNEIYVKSSRSMVSGFWLG